MKGIGILDVSRMLGVGPLILGILAFLPVGSVAEENLESDFFAEEFEETVSTPTRLNQPLNEVPAAVTVITADDIERLQIRSIIDALRLVPGMHVGIRSGNDYRVSYHSSPAFLARRLQVLVDGMSIYRPAIAQME